MFIETLVLENFKCFGSGRTRIDLGSELTAFIGTNGTGKTAACEALLRLFGITGQDRAVRAEDFHIPVDEVHVPATRELTIEALLAFSELDDTQDAGGEDADEPDESGGEDEEDDDLGDDEEIGDDDLDEDQDDQIPEPLAVSPRAVPEFFSRMAADGDGELKVRIVLKATWEDDGTVDGTITETRIVVSTMAEEYGDEDYAPLPAAERSRIQMIYIPASRDGARQVTAFLRGRLWRAAQWSDELRVMVNEHADQVADQFDDEPVVKAVEGALSARWQELHDAGTHASPRLRLLDGDFDQLVRNTELVFEPDHAGRARPARLLSDGQRSLLHLALTAAALDVEAAVYDRLHPTDFTLDAAQLPNLTLIAVEEPENNLSPFFLSRIVSQLRQLAAGDATQAVLSSHSASVLTRIEPDDLRYFRSDPMTATASVRSITLPADATSAGKYVREAVRAHPELYFAKFVVLGEGDTEQLVIPRIAQAQGVDLDPSFVAVVPLGGRHTNHMWKLLNDLSIPHATLLDLDYGRAGAGPARLRDACKRLVDNGISPLEGLANYNNVDDIHDGLKYSDLWPIIKHLRRFGIFFAKPLDLDYIMLQRFHTAYTKRERGEAGPRQTDALGAVIGEESSDEEFWKAPHRAHRLRWYRYLFLSRSKPSSHLRALSRLTDDDLRARAPKVITALNRHIRKQVGL
ncbi:ATP-dependent nuclease [Rugosimonospora africana]|uniref:Chromosome segregation protein SMC n=1 Tax=Rugosimonospora africana TaxID=556532 RepID=A0A8J3QWK2_9ACTN|nr:TOPRIM nucleotidyl transferase/hydrolase domain-containing protein [Rugosimonospora africana]GIH16041.1 chromosome segregation protein SMC [Rugosimonospora africana]